MLRTVSRKSRGSAIAIVAAVLVIGLAVVGTFGYIWFKQPTIEAIVEITPDDAVGVGFFRGGPQMAVDFGVWELGEVLKTRHEDAFAQKLEMLQEVLGFDPTTKTGILKSGFDVFEPIGFSIHMASMEDPAIALYVPVSNREKVEALIQNALSKIDAPSETDSFNGNEYVSVMEGGVRFAFYKDYLVAVTAEHPENTSDLMEKILGGENSLAQNRAWLDGMNPLIEEDWDLLILANAHEARDVWGPILKDEAFAASMDQSTMATLEEAEAVGFAFDLDPEFMRYKVRFTLVDNPTLKLNRHVGAFKDNLASSIPGNPVAAGRIAIDLGALFEEVASSEADKAGIEDMDAQFKELTGMDLENDIISRLGSPISIVIVDGQNEATQNLGGAIWLPLKEGHQVDHGMEALSDVLAESAGRPEVETVGETQWSRFQMEGFDMAWGVHKNHLVFTFGDAISQQVVSGESAPSFLESVKDPKIREYLVEKGYNGGYINLGLLIDKFREQMGPQDTPGMELLDCLDIAYTHSTAEETSGEGEIIIKAKPGSNFADAIKKMVAGPQ